MPQKRNYRRKRKYNKRKLNSNKNFHKGRKMHVARIPRINLKPTSCARRVFWRNTIYITNTGVGPPLSWYATYNLNSPWIINPNSNQNQTGVSGALVSNPNKVQVTHTNDTSTVNGTAYPGLFDNDNSPGKSYRQMCVTGCKFKASFTPQFQQADVQPAGLATVVLSGPNNATITPTTANAALIDDMPYSRIRKILGSQASLAAQGGLSNTKSAYTQLKYSAKKFNDVKDIKDAAQMWANVRNSGTDFLGSHPAEIDRVTLAIVPLMSTPLTGKALPSGLLEVSMEAVILFREPAQTPGTDLAPIIDNSSAGVQI